MAIATTLRRVDFQKTIQDRLTDLWLLERNGISCAITNYGARIVSLIVPDKTGNPCDVVCGFSTLDDYLNAKGKMHGAALGRYANRIANGTFKIISQGEKIFHLPKNDGNNTIHGGPNGFHTRVWNVKNVDTHSITMLYLSKDGEEGFPGNLLTTITYTLTEEKGLKIDYTSECDTMTIVNLSNHTYFNLNGEGSGTIENHTLQINAHYYTPVNSYMIPTGAIAEVAGTPFDFTEPQKIGARINDTHEQVRIANGYDHNFVIDLNIEDTPDITVTGDKSGIIMEVRTEEPGVQFYAGSNLKPDIGKGGKAYEKRGAFALETQHFPDSPNHTNFPSVLLHSGEIYRSSTEYRFRT